MASRGEVAAAADPTETSTLVGRRVRLDGLKARPELNGLLGTVKAIHAGTGRHQVAVDGHKANLLIGAANLH